MQELPLISPEHRSVDTSFSYYVDVAENATKHSVGCVSAASVCWQPQLTAVLNQHTKHSALRLRELRQLSGDLEITPPRIIHSRTEGGDLNRCQREWDSHYLFQGGDKCRSLSVCQLEQLVVEGRGDEAFQGQPEVMGISGQPLHQPPAQSHSLHTEGLLLQEQLGAKTPPEQRHCISVLVPNYTHLQRRRTRLTCGSTVSIKVSTGSTRSLGSRAKASTLQLRAAFRVSELLEVSTHLGIPTALIRKLRQTHWFLRKLAAMRPQSCSRGPCTLTSLMKKGKYECSPSDQTSTKAVQLYFLQ